jgi:6-pyruvoyltetrahydropterin/6-carboxytetrahydropterin synthase
MPQVTVTRRYRFSASHRLNTPLMDEARNFEVYGKCNNPYGHGHNYLLEVAVSGVPGEVTGRLLPLGELDRFVERVILKAVDHRDLNTQVEDFASPVPILVPTTENLAAVVAARLAKEWPAAFPGSTARLEMVRIHETERNIFEVRVCPVERSEKLPPTSGETQVETCK